jgi:hypothetical protein
MSGYLLRVIDLDTIFEPLAPGDARYPLDTGFFSENNVDAKDKYAQLALGDRYHENVGHVRLDTDLRDIFAALGSVPRFNPLPWLDNTGPITTPVIYRQPSRALLTKVDLACRILADGRCEITAQSPDIHSNPNARKNDVLYSLAQPPLWDEAKVPAGVDFEVRYELVSGTGWTLDGGIPFDAWTRLTVGHPGTTLRGQLVYNHATQAEGSIVSQPKVRIHLRRTDFPNTNKTSGVITANLTLSVNPSLFIPVSAWTKTISSTNNAATNYHNPDGNTGSFPANAKAEFNLNGTLNFFTMNHTGAWVLVLSTRWRRDDAETATTDYDVLCEVVGITGGGSLGNPVAAWTQVTQGYVIMLSSAAANSAAPGTYTDTRTIRLSVRQRSTRGYREGGALLPDNFVSGDFVLSNTVVVKPPLPLEWPSIAGWSGDFSETKTVELNPGVSGALSEAIRLTFDASGSVIVGSTQKQLGSGSWLPPGVNPSQIEMRSVMTASGTGAGHATGSEWDELKANWVSFAAGTKVLQSSIAITPAVGSAYRQYQGSIQMRRKSYPSDVVTIPLRLWSQVEYGAPPAYQWPATNWAGVRTAKHSVPFTPENPNAIAEMIGIYFSSNGNVSINRSVHGSADNTQLSAGKWLPTGIAASDVEILVSGNFSGSAGADVNQLGTWTQVLTGSKYLMVQVSHNSAVSGLGASSRNFTGTISLRRKLYPSDVITFNVDLTPTAEITAPVAPNWTGMTLPDLVYTVTKDLDHLRPNLFETVMVSYIMHYGTGTSAKNVVGHHLYDTQISGAPDGIDSDIVVVNTRITPDGWSPADFEWSFRVISGNVDNVDPGVWKGMSNASYSVQLGVTTNHGMGAGTYKRSGVIAIDVRRKAYPSQMYTFTCKLEPTIVLVQNGPAWGMITLPDHATTVNAGAGQNYPGESDADVCSTGYQIAVNDSGVNSFLNKHSYYGSDVVPGKIDNVVDARFTPSNWDVDDLEWKYDIVSEVGGKFQAGYYLPGAVLPPGTWANVTDLKFVAFYSANRTTKNVGDVVTGVGKLNISVRVKSQPALMFTYPTVTFTNRINYVAPNLTLWPRPDFQNWAGTYYHTTSVEVQTSYKNWIGSFRGDTYGLVADWEFTFFSDGTWSWAGNGMNTQQHDGRWAAAPTSGNDYSIRATGIATYGSTATINGTWQSLIAKRIITFSINRPPAGEPDNNGRWAGTVEIRNNVSGEIITGQLVVAATSHR